MGAVARARAPQLLRNFASETSPVIMNINYVRLGYSEIGRRVMVGGKADRRKQLNLDTFE